METALTLLLFIIVIGMMGMFVYSLFGLIGCFSLAPYVATDRKIAQQMVELAGIKKGMHVVEIGSGNGTISVEAGRKGALALGIEFNPVLVQWARFRARRSGVKSVTFVCANVWSYRLPPDTDVVLVYGLPKSMKRLWKKMEAECRPGTLLISHAFSIPGKSPTKREESVLVYTI